MGLLQYANLELGTEATRAQNDVFYGLGDFYRYLTAVRDHHDRPEAVLRIGWRRANPPDGYQGRDGVWVELIDRADGEEAERIRDAFLDEGARDVYDRAPPLSAPEHEDDDERPRKFRWNHGDQIRVLDRHPPRALLLLERRPEPDPDAGGAVLALRPDTYVVGRQLAAIQRLQDRPVEAHRPLVNLFLPRDRVRWETVRPAPVDHWHVLTDGERAGTAEQREFVARALATPDFMLLEGPPGSGKTTAICELILQMAHQGMRMLLCASTHVAVDNVIERIKTYERGSLVMVRVGDEGNVSDAARPYCLHARVRTEENRIREFLSRQRPPSAAQRLLQEHVGRSPGAIERLILDVANLVCGTTIGILQHPEIKGRKGGAPPFDMLVLDEASKTTFQEFLVPGLLARRWVIVGDANQLSPYVEPDDLAVGLELAVPSRAVRDASVDVFTAQHGRHRGATLVVTEDEETVEAYREQAEARGANLVEAPDPGAALADVVIAPPSHVEGILDSLPLDLVAVRGDRAEVWRACRRARHGGDPPDWGAEIAWRMARRYEQRRGGSQKTIEKIDTDLAALEPALGSEGLLHYRGQAQRLRRIALPSVLESLQKGFVEEERSRPTALTSGLPAQVLAERHVILRHQHRMHPAISAVPRRVVYDGTALQDAPGMEARREWSYASDRASWVDVHGEFRKGNCNPMEADAVMAELDRFVRWAKQTPRGDGHPWEVAVLAFYRGQERELRQRLRNRSEQHDAYRTFRAQAAVIQLCTVDRFQGHEADLVLLSFANTRATNFLESQNRLNVALTRARYACKVFGHRRKLARTQAPLLLALQEWEWGHEWGADKGGAS